MSNVCHLEVLLGNLLPCPGLSEYTGVLSGSWSSSELSEVNDRQWHTGLVGVCGELQGVMVTVLWGVVCAGLKDACSMLDTWCMEGVFLKGVAGQQCQNHSRNPHLLVITVGGKAAFSAVTKCPNKTSSDS